MTTPDTTPDTTPAPDPAAPRPDIAAVDQALTERARNSGDYLAGITAAGMLDTAGAPTKLPALLFPDLDPQIVDRVWQAAFVVGYRTRKLVEHPRWTPEALHRLRGALTEAGYHGMARHIARSINTHPAAHPADRDTTARTRGQE